jgi:hypothetical protein
MDRGMSWRRDSATIAGGIAAALGKGLLIATAGFAAAVIFGHPPAAAASLWRVLATAIAGCSCLLAAVVIRREQCDADDAAKHQVRELVSLVKKLPGMESPQPELTEACEPFTSRLDHERERLSVGKGR